MSLLTLPRAAIAVAAVWLMFPHQPDVGLGRPQDIQVIAANAANRPCANAHDGTCDGAVFGPLPSAVADVQSAREALLAAIDRVRADLQANGRHDKRPL